jgi:threonine dehydratase
MDAPDLTHILVATGGGGLIGGMAAWYASSVGIIGVEPETCLTLHTALLSERPVECAVSGLAWCPSGWSIDVSDRSGLRGASGAGAG